MARCLSRHGHVATLLEGDSLTCMFCKRCGAGMICNHHKVGHESVSCWSLFVLVLLSAHNTRFSVSRMGDVLCELNTWHTIENT